MSAAAERRPSGFQPDEPSDRFVQPSLRRMRQFGVRPDHELGQNFLIDSNILGVIDRAAELGKRDVALEIGGGLGVLSEYLAQRVAHVHVIEIDTRLSEPLLEATDPYPNATVHWGDAMTLDLAQCSPAPDKVVANLPYGIAAGVLLRTIEELAGVRVWVAMVQREVGMRLAAAPAGSGRAGTGKGEYGLSSVIAQLACEVRVLRAIPRTVFHPQPNVDSVLIFMRRQATAPSPALRALVGGAFAHRRKTLAGSLVLAGVERNREEIREALLGLGHPADVRAERLAPREFVALAEALGL
jgi:16S rRNA (adenine1518-N6/adenine1519-N6)-dimethyltransferase